LPNCGGSSELSQSLGTQTSVKKVTGIGAKATASVGGEVGISAAAKLKLEAAVESTYQQVYETATSRVDTIVMKAAPMSYVIYVVQWNEQRYESTIEFNEHEKTYETSYSYVLSVPKIGDSYQVSCPTQTISPSPTLDAAATTEALAIQEATAQRIAADEMATAIARKAAADVTATREAGRIIWEKNWSQIQERFRGVLCCPDGKTITNREKYLSNLRGLDLSVDPKLQNDLERLISLIEGAEAYPDPNWNMVLTKEIEDAYDAVETSIRNRAIEYGIDVHD
jgi:hypothetical protein